VKKRKLNKCTKVAFVREKWRGHDRNALCWPFFIVNVNNIIGGSKPQIMKCMIYHVSFVLCNPRTKERRGIITYSKTNGITTLRKHVDVDHVILAKRFEEEVNFPLRKVFEKQFAKKRPNVFNFEILKFFGAKDPFKNDVVQ
jgi:hypothetical protein